MTSPDSSLPSRKHIIALFALLAVLYASGISRHWRMSPDSGRYLTMACQLVDGKGYQFAGEEQYGMPAGLPLFYALVFRLTGFTPSAVSLTEGFALINFAGVLLGFLGVIAAYMLASDLSGRRVGLVVACLVAVSHQYFGKSLGALSDVPYCATSWAAFFFLSRAAKSRRPLHYLAFAALTAASVLLRSVGMALVFAVTVVALYDLLRYGRAGGRHSLGLLLASLPAWGVSLWFVAKSVLAQGTASFSYGNDYLEGRTAGEFLLTGSQNVVDFLRYTFEAAIGESSAAGIWSVFLTIVIVGMISFWRRGNRTPAVYLAVYVLFMASVPAGVFDVRLAIPLLIFLYLYAWQGLVTISQRIIGIRPSLNAFSQWRKTAATVLVLAIVIVNLVDVGKKLADNRRADFYAYYGRGKYADYVSLGRASAGLPVSGRAMAGAWGVVHMLTGWEAVRSPFRTPPGNDPNRFLAEYVRQNGIRTIVENAAAPDERAATVLRFVHTGTLKWREIARFGTLAVYVLQESPS